MKKLWDNSPEVFIFAGIAVVALLTGYPCVCVIFGLMALFST
jgi:hypothetical protein